MPKDKINKEELEKEIRVNKAHWRDFAESCLHLSKFIDENSHFWELVDKNALPAYREELHRRFEEMKYYTNLIQKGQKRLALF